MTSDNVWLAEQQATIDSLQRLIARLEQQRPCGSVKGAGTATSRGPVPLELGRRQIGFADD